MSMMEYIEGISKKNEEETDKMLAAEAACIEAGVPVPPEIAEYLEDEHGIVGKLRPEIDKGVTSHNGDGINIIEIDLSKIDKKIDIIRITKSW